MTDNDNLTAELNHFFGLVPLHGGTDRTGTSVFFDAGTLSIRGLRATKYISISDSFLRQRLRLNDVSRIEFIGFIAEQDVYIESGVTSIVIKDCSFESKLYINKQSSNNNSQMMIDEISIKESNCKGNFKLHNCKINSFGIVDTNFYENADFFKSTIKSGDKDTIIQFKAINFKKLALFGEVEFYSFTLFKYVTFMGYVHFRNATFREGVDLDYVNIEKQINFHGVHGLDNKISKNKTSQETYRIIKHQLRSVGNAIDSNRYHALELEKKRKNTPVFSLEYPVYQLHWLSSKHSQNWLYPLFWIFVTGIITTCYLNYFGCTFKHHFFVEVFDYMSIVNANDCIKNNPIIFILNKISLGYLYYQFLTVVRKDTKI